MDDPTPSKERGVPWPVWVGVTLLVAVIGTFGKLLVDQPASPGMPGTADARPAPPPPIDWTARLGFYSGESINRGTKGATLLEIRSAEPSGRIRGTIEWSQGLFGAGTLVGTTSGETIEFSGTILSNVTGSWDSDVRVTFTSPTSIRGTYRLYPHIGNVNGTQDGQFTLTRTR